MAGLPRGAQLVVLTAMSDDGRPGPANPNLARDHLANERTYLAWLRTAAAVMAFGLAVAGFADQVVSTSVVAGSLLVLVGAVGVGYGTVRYRQVSDQLERGEFNFGSHGRAAIVASTVLVVTVIAALVLLAVGR
jgi:putative membrane protein